MANSTWLDDVLAKITALFNSTTVDAETRQTVKDLKVQLASDEASEAETKAAVNALVDSLLKSVPAVPAPPAA